MNARDELIELIEEVDQINVGSHPVLLELVSWLPVTTISTFIEDARAALELDSPEEEDDIEYPVQGPNWPSNDEDYFVNEGIKAAEAAKKERIERYLQLVQCSEV